MRAAILILVSILATPARASSGESLRELGDCVADVRADHARVSARVPAPILRSDRKLLHMAGAIDFLEANLAYLKNRLGSGTGDAMDAILVANAVEGCRHFNAAFDWRSLRFQWTLVNLAALVVVLTLRLIFSIVPSHVVSDRPIARPRRSAKRSKR